MRIQFHLVSLWGSSYYSYSKEDRKPEGNGKSRGKEKAKKGNEKEGKERCTGDVDLRMEGYVKGTV